MALSGCILSPSCAKMAWRWPNIAQHSAKMSQHSLQEQPQDPKKTSKVLYSKTGRQDAPKSAPSWQSCPLSWPSWAHLGAKLANRHPHGAPDAPQLASWAILAPRGSPRSSKVLLELQFSMIFLEFLHEFHGFFKQLSSISSRRFGTVAAWRAQRTFSR